jgi:hypothetical protein
MATMLQLVQQATAEMGVSVPTAVAGNTTQDVVQQLALINAVGYEVQREHQWQALTVEYRFTTVYYQYTGTTTSGSTTLSALSSTTGLTTTPTYFSVTGTGIEDDTYLVSVNSGASTAVLSQAASASGTVTLTFSQTKYALPSGYDRLIDRTEWDKSQHWEQLGPETAQQWQWLKSGFISTGPRVRFRILGNLYQIFPALSTDDYMGFEYVSNLWVTATGVTTGPNKSSFTVDTDTCIFPDRLMVLGLKKKYLEAKGFDTSAVQKDYSMQLDIAKASDAGSPTLSMAPRPGSVLISWDNIPDSNFGS